MNHQITIRRSKSSLSSFGLILEVGLVLALVRKPCVHSLGAARICRVFIEAVALLVRPSASYRSKTIGSYSRYWVLQPLLGLAATIGVSVTKNDDDREGNAADISCDFRTLVLWRQAEHRKIVPSCHRVKPQPRAAAGSEWRVGEPSRSLSPRAASAADGYGGAAGWLHGNPAKASAIGDVLSHDLRGTTTHLC